MIAGRDGGPLSVFIVAGEESGDQLGAEFMAALSERLQGNVTYAGVGGDRMARRGFRSEFPMNEIALHGIIEALAHAPRVLRRVRQTVDRIVALAPDVVLLIDCPGFNMRVAKRLRLRHPSVPIVGYVSPSVWAYRSGRARWMAPYYDHLLAILPFEPAVHRELGGPPCTYVGHPLIERLASLRPLAGERTPLAQAEVPTLVVLPGSRRTEIARLTQSFGETIARVVEERGPLEVLLPAVPHLRDEIRARVASWPVQPVILEGEEAKFSAFRRAHAALAASGTVTLELALAGVPLVVAYRVDPVVRPLRKMFMRAKSIVLPNLIIGSNVIPEFLDGETTPERLSAALLPLLRDSAERKRQLMAFDRLDILMSLHGTTPSRRAVDVLLETVRDKRLSLSVAPKR